ncbi:hypothetical protein RN001_011602 [Aquatica leii]|uniref:DUF229 domain containing protein n=1 Tax=Aquatica leii TaxID=1421715 RepID=A0AAN7Q0W5_9COLE|nr:hypothetical protein RN001_011602 [Aquatica leii]
MALFKKPFSGNRRYVFVILLMGVSIFWVLYFQPPIKSNSAIISEIEYALNAGSKYLVHSSKCKIPSLDPYNMEILPYFLPKKYINCTNRTKLSYVTKQDDVAVLHINDAVRYEYSNNSINCCYSGVTSSLHSTTFDTIIKISSCTPFENETSIKESIVMVICRNSKDEEIYKNVHAVIKTKEVTAKMQQSKYAKNKPLSVLFIGIDSISRLNMIRSMPNTYNFLEENKWIEFKGYNKIADNTFPNVMAILTGMNESTTFKLCNPKVVGQLDKCNLLWYDYKKLDFITAYAEDEAEISTFNYLKKGFEKKPTDYYFRPYILATERHLNNLILDGVRYCTGPESAGERILNIARDFTQTFKNHSSFGFFWMNSFSHNEINSVSRMDSKTVDFLVDLNRTGVMKNTIVIFLSDHGFRFGSFTYTHAGWLEERLPFFYISVPKWFQKKFPDKYLNLIKNSERLITPYDLYMTLQEVLVLSGRNYLVKKSSACPQCLSLFHEVERERSCEDAGIENHWCTCKGYVSVSTNSVILQKATKFILHKVHTLSGSTEIDLGQCLQYKLKGIISAGVSDNCDIKSSGKLYFLITMETEPHAVFQATVSISVDTNVPTFKMEGTVSRLDIYSHTSWCVNDSILKKYCYCYGSFAYLSSVINSISARILKVFY